MKKDQIIILKDRGLISISGSDAKDFLQNIITNDINKVSADNSIFSGLFTPQGKYLYEFFIIKNENNYFLDCDEESSKELIEHLIKYKLRSKVEIKDVSSNYVVGIISLSKLEEMKKFNDENFSKIEFKKISFFEDPRKKELGGRLLSSLEKLHLIIKKLELRICEEEIYYKKAHSLGVPIKGLHYLKDQLFGLEANFEEFKAIDFKKGCYIGQENTARLKLKNKLRKKLLPLKTEANLKIGSVFKLNDREVGRVLIDKPFPFVLVNLYYINSKNLFKENFLINGKKATLIDSKNI
jgi:folate-binding protein YgfZ